MATVSRHVGRLVPKGPKLDARVDEKIKITAKGIKSLRRKLGLSAAQLAKLVDSSLQSVYSWEGGNSKPRRAMAAKLVAIRDKGKREVNKILDELGMGKKKRTPAKKRTSNSNSEKSL